MKRWLGKARDGTVYKIVGDPDDHPGFKGLVKCGRKRLPEVLIGDELIRFEMVVGTQIDGVACTTVCRKARRPLCQCSCSGKNHGIDNRDVPNAIQAEDVIWIGAP